MPSLRLLARKKFLFVFAALFFAAAVAELSSRWFYSRTLLQRYRPAEEVQRIELAGSEDSGTVLDAQGGWFHEGRPTEILVRSLKLDPGSSSGTAQAAWDRPADIVIRNGKLRGGIRIMGLGRNGEAPGVRRSSRREGHTARARAASPVRVRIENVEIEAVGPIPLYLGPGVEGVVVENCRFTGWSRSVALYLDAESGHNLFRGNTFDLRPAREVFAVDGSADNRIEGNRFLQMPLGGIHLYRNCGEGGTVRHQPPQGNIIAGNRFDTGALGWGGYAVWLGSRANSRAGPRNYCGADAGFPFGSSIDNGDYADRNSVVNNRFTPPSPLAVRDDGEDNAVR